MDKKFLRKVFFCIAKHSFKEIAFQKEKEYYKRYAEKLMYGLYHLNYNGKDDLNKALNFINKFNKTESSRIKNGLIYKPKKIVELVCNDALDVVRSMERWESDKNVGRA